MKAAILGLLAAVFAIAAVPCLAAQQPQTFNTESAAKQHCPADIVVWLNIPSGVYHYAGERWYGRTKNGAYVLRERGHRGR